MSFYPARASDDKADLMNRREKRREKGKLLLSRIQAKMQSGSRTNFSREGRRGGIWVMNGIMIAFTSDYPKLKLNGKRRGGGGGENLEEAGISA